MTNQTVHDPVCHMDIDIRTAAGTSEHDGMTYYFCSGGCKVDFDANPEGVLEAEAAYDHSQPVEHMDMASESDMSAQRDEETRGRPNFPRADDPSRHPASQAEEGSRTQAVADMLSQTTSGDQAKPMRKPWWRFWG